MSEESLWFIGGVLGLVLLYWDVRSTLRFRRRATTLDGTVRAVHQYRRERVFYVEYEFEGTKRVARYHGSAMCPYYEGDRMRILIDPRKPPDYAIPEAKPGPLAALPTGEYCQRKDESPFSVSHALMLGGCLFAIAQGVWPHLWAGGTLPSLP